MAFDDLSIVASMLLAIGSEAVDLAAYPGEVAATAKAGTA